jgi:hypothetical protein
MTPSTTRPIDRTPRPERRTRLALCAYASDLDARIIGCEAPGEVGVQVRPVILQIPPTSRPRPIPVRPPEAAPRRLQDAPAMARGLAAVLAAAVGLERLAGLLVCTF